MEIETACSYKNVCVYHQVYIALTTKIPTSTSLLILQSLVRDELKTNFKSKEKLFQNIEKRKIILQFNLKSVV